MISFEPLWRTLESKQIGKMELREMIGISKATFAKLGKNESVTLETIEKVCTVLQVPIESVVEITPTRSLCGVPGTKCHCPRKMRIRCPSENAVS